MIFAAYGFIIGSVMFFVGMFTINKERDGNGSYIVLFALLLIMVVSGFALSLNALGINPRITI